MLSYINPEVFRRRPKTVLAAVGASAAFLGVDHFTQKRDLEAAQEQQAQEAARSHAALEAAVDAMSVNPDAAKQQIVQLLSEKLPNGSSVRINTLDTVAPLSLVVSVVGIDSGFVTVNEREEIVWTPSQQVVDILHTYNAQPQAMVVASAYDMAHITSEVTQLVVFAQQEKSMGYQGLPEQQIQALHQNLAQAVQDFYIAQ